MKFFKIIAFCSNPVQGSFRFQDVFQIYPLDTTELPTSDMIKFHPFVLEYCLSDDEQITLNGELKAVSKIISELTAQANFHYLVLRLLTALSNFHFFLPGVHGQWFVRVDGMADEEMNKQISTVGLNILQLPKWKEQQPIQAFTKPETKEIEPQKHPEYFQHINIDGKSPVTFSQHLTAALHNYFLLSPEQKASIDSSVQLINQGVKLLDSMKSLSFIAFISAMETMIALEFKDEKIEHCGTCGQQQFKVSARFKEYLLKYVTDNPDEKSTMNKLYELRSKIAHTGILLFGDGKIDWTESVAKDKQINFHLQAMMSSKLSLINWILMRGEKENKK